MNTGRTQARANGKRARGNDAGAGPTAHGRAWIEFGKGWFIGPGRAALLEAIQEQGSITAAAAAVGVSYRAAWTWLEAMNREARQPLVSRAPGGVGGGGTSLTPFGVEVLKAYKQLIVGLDAYLSRASADIRRKLSTGASKGA
jgi:molybdate transport system regulatory protein